jgi:hypothetical protein
MPVLVHGRPIGTHYRMDLASDGYCYLFGLLPMSGSLCIFFFFFFLVGLRRVSSSWDDGESGKKNRDQGQRMRCLLLGKMTAGPHLERNMVGTALSIRIGPGLVSIERLLRHGVYWANVVFYLGLHHLGGRKRMAGLGGWQALLLSIHSP